MAARDAFYILPDSLISFILSKMPIKDAVRCCILSKRWRFLYTHMPTLSFSKSDLLGPLYYRVDPLTISKVENIISSILFLHSRNLEALYIRAPFSDGKGWSFSYENVCRWVRYAACCNVQHLALNRGDLEFPPPALFSCSRLVTLDLTGYVLTSFPTNFVGFPHLISCELHDVQLTNKSLVSLISLCPLLQNLQITGFSGLGNVVIISSTIEHLDVDSVKSLSVKCPKLKILKAFYIDDLDVNGVRFCELSHGVCKVKMDCGDTLRGLSMFCSPLTSASSFLDFIGNFQSLKELVIAMHKRTERVGDRGIPLLNLLHRLPNLQSLSIQGYFVNISFIQELERDPIPDCLASPHVNLKKIRVEIDECGHREVAVISHLLQSALFLERMEIHLPWEYVENYKIQSIFLKDILSQRRASSLARIFLDF